MSRSAVFVAGVAAGVVATFACQRLASRAGNQQQQQQQEEEEDDDDEELKMVLVVRNDLKMGKGKIAAQCCHAAVHCVDIASEEAPALLQRWNESATAKVCLKTDSEDELLRIAAAAEAAGVVHSVIQDAGRTQIAAGSRTVCGLGPARITTLDKITGGLKLL